jgi:hypothetical protein
VGQKEQCLLPRDVPAPFLIRSYHCQSHLLQQLLIQLAESRVIQLWGLLQSWQQLLQQHHH